MLESLALIESMFEVVRRRRGCVLLDNGEPAGGVYAETEAKEKTKVEIKIKTKKLFLFKFILG